MVSLQIQRVSFSYLDGQVLHNINLFIKAGEMVGLLGPNGSGKTTLIKLASGVLKPKQGEIKLDGEFFSFYRTLISSIALVFLTWLGMTVSLSWQFLFVLAIAMPGAYFAILYACKVISQHEVAYIGLGFSQLAAQIVGKLRAYRE